MDTSTNGYDGFYVILMGRVVPFAYGVDWL